MGREARAIRRTWRVGTPIASLPRKEGKDGIVGPTLLRNIFDDGPVVVNCVARQGEEGEDANGCAKQYRQRNCGGGRAATLPCCVNDQRSKDQEVGQNLEQETFAAFGKEG